MSFIPLPEGNNTPETVRRLRALDAEFFGSISAARGALGSLDVTGNITVDTGSITAGDTTSSFYVQMDELGLSFPYGGTLQSEPDLWPYIRTGIGSINPGEMSVQLLISGAFWSGFDSPWITMGSDDYTSGSNPYIQMGIGSMASDVFTIESGQAVVSDDAVLLIANGNSFAPSLGFATDTNTGMYRIAADAIGIATGGVERVEISTTAFQPALPIRGSLGTAAAPAYSFSSDTDIGMYRISADAIGFATGGARRLSISNTGVSFGTGGAAGEPRIDTGVGTQAAPAYRFVSDEDTGMFRIGVNALGFSGGNSLMLNLQAAVGEKYIYGLSAGTQNALHFNTSTGQITYVSSRRAIKKNIKPLPFTDDFDRLRPVRFDYRDGSRDNQFGFIAEEVADLFPSLGIWGHETATGPEEPDVGERMIVNYEDRGILALLVAGLQDARRRIAELEREIAQLRDDR